MTIPQLKIAIENSEYFQTYPESKQRITLEKRNIERLHDLYGQADRLVIQYLQQRTNLTVSDVKLIQSVL